MKHLLAEQSAVGSAWKSCRTWKSKGGTAYWDGIDGKPMIEINQTDSEFYFYYYGPASGYVIATPGNERDSIHQLFNVIVCEMNPVLITGGKKPIIDNIRSNGYIQGKDWELHVRIPLEDCDPTLKYQINRRGGWGHDPGSNSILSSVKGSPNLEGPVKIVTNIGSDKITEYFVTYTV